MTAERGRLPERHLPLPGTYNVRDLGGYPTSDGRVTRWRTFFRADSLHRLTPEAQTALLDHGVRSIIDLRRSDELHAAPNVFARSTTIRYHHLSLLVDAVLPPVEPQPLCDTYRHLLDERQEQIGAALRTLTTPWTLPAVVHCTAGKDRTGLIVALVLGLVGVPDETIVADYALSAAYLQGPFVEETRQRALARGYTWEQYLPLTRCPPEFMRTTLQHVQERYGGMAAYARTIGLTREHLDYLRQTLVE
jgi:protein-tyrosine phosphatase